MTMWSALNNRYKKILTLLGFATTLVVVSVASYAYADYFSWSQLPSSPYVTSWSDVAMSSNGYVLAVRSDLDQYVYVSDDAGAMFTSYLISNNLVSVSSAAVSVDGTYMMAGTSEGVYVSNDNGASWNLALGSPTVLDVAMSIDGRYRGSLSSGGGLYVSNAFSGSAWVYRAGGIPSISRSNLKTLDISDNGQVLAAAGTNTQIYVTTNGGLTWTAYGPSLDWRKVVMSGDGTKMAGVTYGGNVYISNDSGQTWNSVTSLGARFWSSVAMSDNGSIIAVSSLEPGGDGRYLYTSTDGGTTWVPESGAPAGTLIQGVGFDNNGVRLLVASSNSYLYMGTDNQSPRIRGVTATNNSGAYRVGVGTDSIIGIMVEFTEPVYVVPGNTFTVGLNNARSVSCGPYGNSGRFMLCNYVIGSSDDINQLNVLTFGGAEFVNDMAGNVLASIVANPLSYTLAGTKNIKIDNQSPVNSNIASSTAVSSATITWNTNELASSTVAYGTSTGNRPLRSSAEIALATSHTATLSSLAPNTRYFFVVVSTDEAGNVSTSTERTFQTTILPEIVADNDASAGIAPQNPYASGGYSSGHVFSPSYLPTDIVVEHGVSAGTIKAGGDAVEAQQNLLVKYPLSIKANRRAFLNPDATVFKFTNNMYASPSPKSDAKKLQAFLNYAGYPVAKYGPGSIGRETTTFGPATRAALIRFQKALGISPASGNFGPATRASVNSIIEQLWR